MIKFSSGHFKKIFLRFIFLKMEIKRSILRFLKNLF
jgi:hypothetical protein